MTKTKYLAGQALEGNYYLRKLPVLNDDEQLVVATSDGQSFDVTTYTTSSPVIPEPLTSLLATQSSDLPRLKINKIQPPFGDLILSKEVMYTVSVSEQIFKPDPLLSDGEFTVSFNSEFVDSLEQTVKDKINNKGLDLYYTFNGESPYRLIKEGVSNGETFTSNILDLAGAAPGGEGSVVVTVNASITVPALVQGFLIGQQTITITRKLVELLN